ncbi:hypothetical protein [Sunxiuqinia sp. sy24]|uniref:hypothetical protein n=1 Tax=Sunxiuqinia sp. sy24 TaxID=3461495 RepID=UPI0040462EC4
MSNQVPIRVQLNHTKKNWQVARQTTKGAWEVISNMTHNSPKEADAMVDWYVSSFPGKYCKAK